MAASLLLVSALLVAGATGVPSTDHDIGSPLRIAQCRATCLKKFSSGQGQESSCLQGPDCFMCWENCELLQSNFPVWGAMCSEKGICFPGCQQACRFHRGARGRQSQPVIPTRGEEVIQLSDAAAYWPRPPTADPATPLVFLLMRRLSDGHTWKQVAQTVEMSVKLSTPVKDPATIRVLVVGPSGLLTIYSPLSGSGSLTQHLDSWGMLRGGQRKKINTEINAPTLTPSRGRWILREVSLMHQKVLVLAEVAWEPRAPRGVYLVTWEVDGGGLRGNLFTDATCVTLSLWPDTVYHIQVELISPGGSERSEPLELDTRRASPPASTAASGVSSPLLSVLVRRRSPPGPGVAAVVAAGAGAAALLALAAAAVLVLWRRRGAKPQALLDGQGDANTDIPPAVTLGPSKGKNSRVFPVSPKVQLDSGISNPLLLLLQDEEATTRSFLQAAERGADNEVQV